MGYVLTDRQKGGKRIRELDGTLTPFFFHPDQAIWYIKRRLQNSPYVFIHKVKDSNPKKEEKKDES